MQKIIKAIQVIFLTACILTILSGIYVPIYIDEVVMQWIRASFFSENQRAFTLFPQCLSSYVTKLPLALYVPALVNSLIFQNLSLFGLRLTGIVCAFLYFVLLYLFSRKIIKDKSMALLWFILVCAISTLGTLPYILVLSRTESFMVISLLALSILPFCNRHKSIVIKFVVLLFLTGMLCFSHPKSIFFVPYIYAVAIYTFWGRTKVIFASIVLVSFIAFQTYEYASLLANCSEAPEVMRMFSMHTLSLNNLLQNPFEFFVNGIKNLVSMPFKVSQHIKFSEAFQSNWLPPIAVPTIIKLLGLFNYLLVSLYIFLCISSPLFLLIFRKKRDKSIVLAFFLAVGLISNSIFFNVWHFYGAQQIIPLCNIIVLLLFAGLDQKIANTRFLTYLYLLIICASLASMISLVLIQYPKLYANSQTSTFPIETQQLSSPHLSKNANFLAINDLARQCNISTESTSKLVVDHYTYYAFSKINQPIHIAYVSEIAFGGDLVSGKLVPFLRSIGSSGIIISCKYESPQFYGLTRFEQSGFCCYKLAD
jgi:hypothetical protein